MGNTAKKIIWVERLRLREIIIFILRGIFANIIIHYDEHQISYSGKSFLNLSNRLNLCKNFYPAFLKLNEKDYRGYNYNYQFLKNLNTCVEGFCEQYIPSMPDWFKNMTKNYLATLLFYRVTFITMVEIKVDKMRDVRHELSLIRHPVNSLIIKYYKERGFTIKQSFTFIGYLRIIIAPFYYLIMTLFHQIVRSKVTGNIGNGKPAIWVEYEGSESAFLTLSFWRGYVEAKKIELVYYIDRKDIPVSEETVNHIRQFGFKWIDCNRIFRLGYLCFNDINELLMQFIKFNYKQPIWFHFFKLEYAILYKLYYSVYKRFQVKILIQHQETLWKQEVQAKAVEAAGGIMLGFQWSNYPFILRSTHLHPQHVYFVWGKVMHDCLQEKGNTCRYILPSGMWITIDKQRPPQLEDFSVNGNFILAIFDTSTTYVGHVCPDSVSQFYLTIIKLLENNTSWKGILKIKNNIYFLQTLSHGENIISRLKSFVERKKLVIFDANSNVSPPTATIYANLCVACSLNSAGIIAGVYNCRTIFWDCSGFGKHSFYKKQGQQIIYHSLEDFEKAIYKVSAGDLKIGDFSHWRKGYNYFNDFLAPKRVGKFIQTFMDEVIRTDNMEHSLNLAVKQYIEENKIGEDFFKPEGWWDE